MDCPVCKVTLTLTERSGIEIDYCPKCRGVWLDRGELDKIIERSAGMTSEYMPSKRPYDDDEHRHHRKRKSFLGEIFDFD